MLSEKKISERNKKHNPPPFKLNGRSLIVFNMCTICKMGVGTVGNVYTVSLPQNINLPEADNYDANRDKQYKK